ncbi:MAG: glycoside hydrolase domain-containing protein [Terriglobales bacterium]
MRNSRLYLTACGLAASFLAGGPGHAPFAQTSLPRSQKTYLGFDRNDYPGDGNLSALRQTFSFTGYWLNPPPGARTNTWLGKRQAVSMAGLGFLVLFNGRLDVELKKAPDPSGLGRTDATAALASARREGFPQATVIFLDQEEGGRMLPEQKAYLYAWIDGVNAGGFRAGIYCSGIAAGEDGGVTVITAEDIRQNAGRRSIVYWVTNDACPPSPGCAFPREPPLASESGVTFALVWQLAQSPKRRDVARGCHVGYARDGNCYPPRLAREKLFVDVDSAGSADPSAGG